MWERDARADGERTGTVLIADDSPMVRLMVRAALELEGYDVIEAADGQQTLDQCRAYEPDVVLLDILMPVRDGYEVLAELKTDPILRDTPVVFLTAKTGQDDVNRGLAMGAHDYLRKPFEPTELAARVRAAIRVKLLQDELRARNAVLELMARTDVLTGLHNRRHLTDHLRQAAALAHRQGTPIGVLMIDIDHFKIVNDRLGHEAGDAVLRRVSLAIQSSVRVCDTVGRWGGEEFIAVLPNADIDGAREVAERVRSAVEAGGRFDDSGLRTTVSVGCASGTGADIEELLRAADAALYDAKMAGRNRVACAAPAPSRTPADVSH
jgi:diguanylate cyclase (GGDEF)-like protein